MKFFKSIFACISIWGVSALLNAIISGIWISLFTNEFKDWPVTFLLVFILTLVFSIPGMFIFWIILMGNWNKDMLFRYLLKAGFIISVLSSLLLYIFYDTEISRQQFFLSYSIVIAAIASIMIHHSFIENNFIIKKSTNYV